jgi:hypothetical protein
VIADDDEDGNNPIDFFINGNADGSVNGDGFYNSRNEIVIGNGGARAAGPSPSINQPFQGYIAEIVAYDVVLTTPQRQQVEAYLNAKYAIYSPIKNNKISIKKTNAGVGKISLYKNST